MESLGLSGFGDRGGAADCLERRLYRVSPAQEAKGYAADKTVNEALEISASRRTLQRNWRMPVRCGAHDPVLSVFAQAQRDNIHARHQRALEPFNDANTTVLKSSGIDENISECSP